MKQHNKIKMKDFDISPYISLEEENILIAAGGKKNNNIMVTNDFTFGTLHGQPVVSIHLAGDYYTRGYVEKKGEFSINLLHDDKTSKDIIKKLQSTSGRDEDKFDAAGLTVNMINGVPSAEEAKYVLNCKVIYRNKLEKNDFFDDYKKTYKKKYKKSTDYTYVGEIVDIFEITGE